MQTGMVLYVHHPGEDQRLSRASSLVAPTPTREAQEGKPGVIRRLKQIDRDRAMRSVIRAINERADLTHDRACIHTQDATGRITLHGERGRRDE